MSASLPKPASSDRSALTDVSKLSAKLEAASSLLRQNTPLLVAFSGGVDSAFLLALAGEVCGDGARGVIADSPSLPRAALASALALAEKLCVPVEVLQTQELENPAYASNPINRCYFCKAELFTRMDELAASRGYRALLYGENADDAGHFRPGAKAAAEFQVLAPLKQAGLTKAEIRQLSRDRNLPTADAPSQPCLSSRIPHGTPVTTEALAMVEAAEELVRSHGFKVFRVRHIVRGNGLAIPFPDGDPIPPLAAKLQIATEEAHRVPQLFPFIRSGLLELGYQWVELDPSGYTAPA